MLKQLPWSLWFAGALCGVSMLAAALEPFPPIFLGLCLIAAVCFAIRTIRNDDP